MDELAVNTSVISETVAKKGEIGCLQYRNTKVKTLKQYFLYFLPLMQRSFRMFFLWKPSFTV